MKRLLSLLIMLTILVSCNKNKDEINLDINLTGEAVIIVNEGNYTYGNASITIYDLTNNKTYQNAFEKVNSFKLGDVAQSAYVKNNYLYIVVNNSGKIIRTSALSLKYIDQLTDMISPRYICFLSENKAITSDLYSPFLYLWDTQQMQMLRKIYLGYSSEKILIQNEKIFVISWRDNDMIFKIDAKSLSVEDSLTVSYEPNSLVIDKNGYLWVLSDGGLWEGAPRSQYPALTCIDPKNMSIDTTFFFTKKEISPSHLTINRTADTLFFLISAWTQTQDSLFGCYKMSINDTLLPSQPFIYQRNHTFYALNYIPYKDWLIITDAKDFSSEGLALIYTTQGESILTIPTGINPGFVLLKK